MFRRHARSARLAASLLGGVAFAAAPAGADEIDRLLGTPAVAPAGHARAACTNNACPNGTRRGNSAACGGRCEEEGLFRRTTRRFHDFADRTFTGLRIRCEGERRDKALEHEVCPPYHAPAWGYHAECWRPFPPVPGCPLPSAAGNGGMLPPPPAPFVPPEPLPEPAPAPLPELDADDGEDPDDSADPPASDDPAADLPGTDSPEPSVRRVDPLAPTPEASRPGRSSLNF